MIFHSPKFLWEFKHYLFSTSRNQCAFLVSKHGIEWLIKTQTSSPLETHFCWASGGLAKSTWRSLQGGVPLAGTGLDLAWSHFQLPSHLDAGWGWRYKYVVFVPVTKIHDCLFAQFSERLLYQDNPHFHLSVMLLDESSSGSPTFLWVGEPDQMTDEIYLKRGS